MAIKTYSIEQMFAVCTCASEHNPHTYFFVLLQQSNLEAFKIALSAKVSDNELTEVWLQLLNQLIEDIERWAVD